MFQYILQHNHLIFDSQQLHNFQHLQLRNTKPMLNLTIYTHTISSFISIALCVYELFDEVDARENFIKARLSYNWPIAYKNIEKLQSE